MQCPSCQAAVDDAQHFCPSCGKPVVPSAPAAAAPACGGQATAAAAAAGPDPMIGATLGGKYKVARLLGEGGMGAVYEGEQQLGTAKRKVAVKTLHPHLSRDPKVKARFEREVGTIAELEHPNTIQVFDFGSTPEGILYIVMELLQGKSLADVLEKDGPMPPDRANRIFQQVCGSLAEAHDRGIVHRDLKPDNVVLVERAGQKDFVKVLDFGIAKRSKEEDKNEQKLTQQGMVLGTPPYMSPEQFTGRPIDARSDIYSLGVMAYEMLTGKLPFKADTAFEWATQHMTQNPIPIESLAEGMRAPEAMREAIKRALAKAPDNRFQTVRELADAFSGGAAAGTQAAAPAGASGGRARTEIGAPIDAGAAFGASPAAAAPPVFAQPQPQPPQAPAPYTPAAGNMAMPAPAAIPRAPARGAGGGGNRNLIIAGLGVAGIALVALIGVALHGSGGGGSAGPLPSSSFASDPVTVLSGSAPPVDTSAPVASGGGDVPPLAGGGGGGGGGHAVPGGGGGHGSASSSSGGGGHAKYDGPDCQSARRLKAAGQARAAQPYVLSCIAHGGTP